ALLESSSASVAARNSDRPFAARDTEAHSAGASKVSFFTTSLGKLEGTQTRAVTGFAAFSYS
ncbi:hypothetical protein, partial [Stenotrophomonas muris]|uniref:hypothetical protein n=1 Tax=Stenotrophomonas muris TaxID=2963283 RepID=UPI00300F3B08